MLLLLPSSLRGPFCALRESQGTRVSVAPSRSSSAPYTVASSYSAGGSYSYKLPYSEISSLVVSGQVSVPHT